MCSGGQRLFKVQGVKLGRTEVTVPGTFGASGRWWRGCERSLTGTGALPRKTGYTTFSLSCPSSSALTPTGRWRSWVGPACLQRRRAAATSAWRRSKDRSKSQENYVQYQQRTQSLGMFIDSILILLLFLYVSENPLLNHKQSGDLGSSKEENSPPDKEE